MRVPKNAARLLAVAALVAGVVGVHAAGASTPHGVTNTAPRSPIPRVHGVMSRNAALGTVQGQVNVKWWGGPLVENPKVVMVLWGNGTYLPEVTSSTAPNFPSFFGGVLSASSYLNTFAEYGVKGTRIGKGSYSTRIEITPKPVNDGPTIDDAANIQPSLRSQILHGNLPAPDANTIYFLFFPQGKTITLDGQDSETNFCAYHSTTKQSGFANIRYAVMPYSAQDAGCGGSPGFDNMTSVSSHELFETATDPDIGFALDVGPSLTWYNPTTFPNGGAEIMDMCNAQQATITGGDGRAYTVQKTFSDEVFNATGDGLAACISSAPSRTFNLGTASMEEGDVGTRVLRIPVTLSTPSMFDQAVNWAVTSGTAHGSGSPGSGVDFITAHGTMQFNARTTSPFTTVAQQYINVTIEGDTTPEPSETFRVALSTTALHYTVGRASVNATIFNDDTHSGNKVSVGDMSIVQGVSGNRQISFPISLSRPALGTATVHWKLTDGSAHLGVDYSAPSTGTLTIPKGGTVGYVNVTIPPHATYPSTTSFTLSITSIAIPGGGVIFRSTGTGTIWRP